MLERFVLGLQPEIKNIMKSQNYVNMMDATMKEALRIQELHQILPSKKKEETKIHAISEKTDKKEEVKMEEPTAPWKIRHRSIG